MPCLCLVKVLCPKRDRARTESHTLLGSTRLDPASGGRAGRAAAQDPRSAGPSGGEWPGSVRAAGRLSALTSLLAVCGAAVAGSTLHLHDQNRARKRAACTVRTRGGGMAGSCPEPESTPATAMAGSPVGTAAGPGDRAEKEAESRKESAARRRSCARHVQLSPGQHSPGGRCPSWAESLEDRGTREGAAPAPCSPWGTGEGRGPA